MSFSIHWQEIRGGKEVFDIIIFRVRNRIVFICYIGIACDAIRGDHNGGNSEKVRFSYHLFVAPK